MWEVGGEVSAFKLHSAVFQTWTTRPGWWRPFLL